MATPPMGVPDEPSHAYHAAAVARGQLTGDPAPYPSWKFVEVPLALKQAGTNPCFAGHPTQSASCLTQLSDSGRLVRVYTTAGTYNPLYYFPVGLPSLVLRGSAVLYGMRLVSAAINAALLAAAAVALVGMRSRLFGLLGLGVGVTPMVVFLSGAVNPSGMEIAAGGMTLAWLSNVAARARDGRSIGTQMIPLAIGGVVLANTRAIALAWLFAYVVATLADRVVLLRLIRRPAFWIGGGVVAAGAVVSLAWTIGTNTLTASAKGPNAGESFLRAFLQMVEGSVSSVGDYVGVFGWLDTVLPTGATLLWSGAVLALVAAALVLARGRTWRAALIMALALVLLPAIIQGRAAHSFGFIWQGRYNLALVLGLTIAAGVALDAAFPRAALAHPARRFAMFAVTLLSVLHLFVFLWVARRYVVGESAGWSAMLRAPQWEPPGTWYLWALVMLVAVALASWATLRCIGDGIGALDPVLSSEPDAASDSSEQHARSKQRVRSEQHVRGDFTPEREPWDEDLLGG